MSNVYTLELNLQKKCGENNGPCNCTRDGDFVAKKDDSIPGAIGFIRYTHELRNASEQTFTLQTNLRNRQTIKGDPVPNVKEVAVYFWKDHLGKPILIGIKKKGTSPPDYYSNSYISAGKSYWSNAGNENKELAQLLDENNCKRNGAVPFDIQNPTKDHAPGCNSTCLKTRNIGGPSPRPAPPGGEYTIQEYIVNHNSNDYLDNGTKISRVTFGGQSTNGIDLPRSYAVSRVRMFSHADSQSNNIPLMLQFVQKGGTVSRWFYNKDKDGTDWKEVDDVYGFYSDSIGVYPTEDLTTKLDNVRCLRDSLVTMNLGKGVSGSYCCIYHKKKGDQGKVTVSEEIVPAGSIQYSKHSISSGDTKLAKIKFSSQWNQGTEIKITLSKQNLPIMGPVAIYAFYCERNGPVLIYVDRGSAQGWYRKPNSNSSGKDEQWEKADELDGVTPETINNCTHWNKVVSKLRDSNSGLKDCPKETAKRLQEQGQQSERETRTGNEGPGQDQTKEEEKDKQLQVGFIPRKTKLSELKHNDTKTPPNTNKLMEVAAKIVDEVKQEIQDVASKAAPTIIDKGEDGDTQDKLLKGITGTIAAGLKEDTGVKLLGNLIKLGVYGSELAGLKTLDATLRLAENITKTTPSLTVGPPGEKGDRGPDVKQEPEEPPVAAPTTTAARGGGQEGSPNSPGWQVISGISSGILGTSALACFAGWKLYNRYNGDPWVRQI